MSSLELSSVLAERKDIVSPERGWRCGSMETPWHTSESSEAVMSLTSLCLIEGKPPVGHDKHAWSILNEWPQLHWGGWLFRGQLYLRHKTSLKADLWRVKPWFSMGRAISHIDAPFSCESSTHLWRRSPGSRVCKFLASSFRFDCFFEWAIDFRCCWDAWQFSRDCAWSITQFTSGALMSFDIYDAAQQKL